MFPFIPAGPAGWTGDFAGSDQHLDGGAGNDKLYGGPNSETLDGGEGDDLLYGSDGDDSLAGGTGNDMLCGGAGNDQMHANDGNDKLYGGDGNDMLFDSNIQYDIPGKIVLQGDEGFDEFFITIPALNRDDTNDTFKNTRTTIGGFKKGEDKINLSSFIDGYDEYNGPKTVTVSANGSTVLIGSKDKGKGRVISLDPPTRLEKSDFSFSIEGYPSPEHDRTAGFPAGWTFKVERN